MPMFESFHTSSNRTIVGQESTHTSLSGAKKVSVKESHRDSFLMKVSNVLCCRASLAGVIVPSDEKPSRDSYGSSYVSSRKPSLKKPKEQGSGGTLHIRNLTNHDLNDISPKPSIVANEKEKKRFGTQVYPRLGQSANMIPLYANEDVQEEDQSIPPLLSRRLSFNDTQHSQTSSKPHLSVTLSSSGMDSKHGTSQQPSPSLFQFDSIVFETTTGTLQQNYTSLSLAENEALTSLKQTLEAFTTNEIASRVDVAFDSIRMVHRPMISLDNSASGEVLKHKLTHNPSTPVLPQQSHIDEMFGRPDPLENELDTLSAFGVIDQASRTTSKTSMAGTRSIDSADSNPYSRTVRRRASISFAPEPIYSNHQAQPMGRFAQGILSASHHPQQQTHAGMNHLTNTTNSGVPGGQAVPTGDVRLLRRSSLIDAPTPRGILKKPTAYS